MITERRSMPGCTPFLIVLILGLLGGAVGVTAFLGLGPNELWARLNGRAAPVLIEVTPTPVMQIVGGAAAGRRLVWRAPIPLDSDTSEPELLVISRNYDRKSDSVLLFSPDAGKVRWESPPLGDNGNSWVVAASAQTVIIADEATLIGISRSDGSKLWEAPLTDRVFYNGCVDCLQVFGDVVVVLSDDGQLQAFNTAKGAPLWTIRLNQATRQLVRVGDKVGVPDSLTKDGSDAGLLVYDPLHGTLERTIEPTCKDEDASYEALPHYFDYILAEPQTGSLYWMLQSTSCLLRIGTGTFGGEQRTYNEHFFSFDQSNALAANGNVYISTNHEIYVAESQGQVRLLITNEDYTLKPLEARVDALLVLAQRNRGSLRLELWLIDPTTGAQRWTRVLSANDPINGLYDDGDFAAHMLAESLVLIEQTEGPDAIHFERLSLSNGTSSVSTQLPVEDADESIRGVIWGNASAWLAVDVLYGVNLENGGTVMRWP
ncbi:MAG: PQQ-binding-like beta-propeller repeat protein [Oscillochloris sp.]|nr:PQQ-binding-like beta-propeller repeat protein [Oscillochloris sp.]